MNIEDIRVRYNVLDVSSIKSFYMIKGGYTGNCKDVYFFRAKGIYTDLLKDIEDMEKQMRYQINQGLIFYDRINSLERLLKAEEIEYYSNCFSEWKRNNCNEISIKASINNHLLSKVISVACKDTLTELRKTDGTLSESIEKNFVIKLLFWTDKVFEKAEIKWDISKNTKIVAANVDKKHEYLFYYFLTRLGIDVLLIQNNSDIPDNLRSLSLSKEINIGDFGEIQIKEFDRN